MKKHKKTIFIVLSIIFVFLIAYFGFYIYLRKTHYFIHRAGRYATPNGMVNHYIEARGMPDGPMFFAGAMFVASQNGQMSDKEFKRLMTDSHELSRKDFERRKRHLAFFGPLAFLETLFWKIFDPNPLKRNTEQSHAGDGRCPSPDA